MMNFHKKSHEVPGLNTSSLPDLIFSVLFFFMIVTHMRQVTLKVDCRLPQGKELTRLTKKSAVSHIYIGKPTKEVQAKYGTGTQIQLNDKFASAPEVMDYISAEKKRMSPEDQKQMTVSIKADQETKMGVITDVKQALRQAKALKISYSATEKGKKFRCRRINGRVYCLHIFRILLYFAAKLAIISQKCIIFASKLLVLCQNKF